MQKMARIYLQAEQPLHPTSLRLGGDKKSPVGLPPGSGGIGSHPSSAVGCSQSVSHQISVFPESICCACIVQTVQRSSCSFHAAGIRNGHPNAPNIAVPSLGAVAASSNAEQGESHRPSLAPLFAGRFDFDFGFWFSILLGFVPWGRVLIGVRTNKNFKT
jgi:hypothetical protein